MSQQRGFSLIELLVVMSILAIATAASMLAMPSGARQQLEEEALRLETRLEIARSQSRASGVPVSVRVDAQGFAFDGLAAARQLSAPWMHASTSAPAQTLLLGPEPVIAAQRVLLHAGGQQLVLASDGVRPFEVQAP